jgi:hypothetical protein
VAAKARSKLGVGKNIFPVGILTGCRFYNEWIAQPSLFEHVEA